MPYNNQHNQMRPARKIRISRLVSSLFILSVGSITSSGLYAQKPGWRPADDYLTNLINYTFKNTRGIMDTPYKLIPTDPENPDPEDPDSWEFITPEEEQYLIDKDIHINFPKFTFFDENTPKSENPYPLEPGQKRQRTHTVEHILYALPGDPISLYPYYGLDELPNFNDRFSHWYDFTTGGRVTFTAEDGRQYDLLDFPADRDHLQISDNYGFYGGIYMNPGSTTPAPIRVYTVQDFIDAVNYVNDVDHTAPITLMADLDFSDENGNPMTDIPMIGDVYDKRYFGTFNGNGHTISHLIYNREGGGRGFIGCTGDNAVIMNLKLDETCSFSGSNEIGGVVGFYGATPTNGGSLTLRNISMQATVYATDATNCKVGGLIGASNEPVSLIIEDCYVGGKIGKTTDDDGTNAALIGWWKNEGAYYNSSIALCNVVVNCTLNGYDTDMPYIRHDRNSDAVTTEEGMKKKGEFTFSNCYGNLTDPCWENSDPGVIAGWKDATTPGTSELTGVNVNNGPELLKNNKDNVLTDDNKRKPGTSATFFFPDHIAGEGDTPLPTPTGRSEYVIAADFSQTFQLQNHIDVENMEITEPLIASRHIFRIRDGRKFAAEFAGSLEKNREYIRKHQKMVSARAGVDFQIRLEAPLPTGWGTTGGVTNFYYRATDGTYHRVRQFGIRVLDGDTRELWNPNNQDDDVGFQFGADIKMKRSKASADKHYAEGDGEYAYHSMLTKDNPDAKHYIVQVIGKDNYGNIIMLNSEKGAPSDYLILMEYNITFLPEAGASLLTEESLYNDNKDKDNNDKYAYARDANMKAAYGDPVAWIDFDEYFKINKLDNKELKEKLISYSYYKIKGNSKPVYEGKTDPEDTNGREHTFFKWPVRWSLSSYSFGYNYRHDYNMYMLATHTENVPFHVAADTWTDNISGDGNGLYDRLYYKTKRLNEEAKEDKPEVEQGYFYYVNAATDPGVSARLEFDIPCPGSRVIISAWVAECSPIDNDGDESSNISFNFVAVMNDTGERIVLHNFITGYVDEYDDKHEGETKTGKWLNVYYSFVPRLAEFYSNTVTFDDVDHFELELAHNGKKSAGADYAIDDIRAYVIPPLAETDQLNNICTDEDIRIEVSASFETLLEKIGLPESFGDDTGEDISLYYAFVAKDEYDAAYNNGKGDATEAFNNAVVDLSRGKGTSGSRKFGKITFKSNYTKNKDYSLKEDTDPISTAYRRKDESGERLIVFEEEIPQGKLKFGKEYYIVFKSALNEDGSQITDPSAFFALSDDCAYKCVTSITPLNIVKIDGEIRKEYDKLIVCENQSPMIQVNIWGKNDTTGEYEEVEKNAHFDWFYGTLEEFEAYAEKDNENHTLKDALSVFRSRYPEAENVDGIKADETKPDGKEMLEKWMLEIIEKAATPEEGKSMAKLLMYQASYVMPPIELSDETGELRSHVVAVPIPDTNLHKGYVVCTAPTELEIKVGNKTPLLRHGLTDMPYPDDLDDVPLRIGLDQLRGNTLSIPLRRVASSDDKIAGMDLTKESVKATGEEREEKEGCLFLVQTNDPQYKDLGTADIVDGEKVDVEDLLWVGEITELHAATGASGNLFKAEFKPDFDFKEGYFYRLRFQFEEKAAADNKSDIETNAEVNSVICSGQDVFTLKIVPRYLLWTGGKNLNWNNDTNWSRPDQDCLYSEEKEGRHKHYVTDGHNSRKAGYSPLDFTSVVVDNAVEAPYMYEVATSEKTDFYSADKTWLWPSSPNPDEAEIGNLGAPTSLIQYDMAAYLLSDVATIGCRPWYANTCKEIHFKPGGTIMRQQHLAYEKAWVDVETVHSRWYTLAMPLQEIYTGEFYLPTAGARQETMLFEPMTFDNELKTNHRFKPAVYQRGWDKATAKVYELENPGFDGPRNVAVKAFWSHVYNDVKEEYSGGVGFSIKTDVSQLNDDNIDKVLFRLPKADAEYLYFNQDGTKNGHKTTIPRGDGHHKLNPSHGEIKAMTAESGKYFLVGNPLMTHLDVRKFLNANKEILQPTYRVVTKSGELIVAFAESGPIAADPDALSEGTPDYTVVAPMQGFFVEAKTAAKEITLKYDESMMRRYDASAAGNTHLTAVTRSGNVNHSLRITALNHDVPSSTSLLVEPSEGTSQMIDVAAMDHRDLDISSTVYTIKGNRALSINFSDSFEGVEVGVIADPDTETTLCFDEVGDDENLWLFDKETQAFTPVVDGLRYNVKGNVASRLFLTSAGSVKELSLGIEWSIENGVLTVTDNDCTGQLQVKVYDPLGRMVKCISDKLPSLSIPLTRGVYIVEMESGNNHKSCKIRL